MPQKNIVLCFDGTWNTPAQSASPTEDASTNVWQFFERVSKTDVQGNEQIKWYNQGVGTEWLNRVRGGAFGLQLDRHIIDGYRKLIELYEPGDDIYLVGFSRGAYTARSLVGLVRNSGLLKGSNDELIDRAYAMYRSKEGVDSEHALAFRRANSYEIEIKFVGVWDTVGALGVPLRSFAGFDAKQYDFHDTKLSAIVRNAFQALAVDEHREPYKPTFWQPQDPRDIARGQTLKQLWFSGAHADVGGGYKGGHSIAHLSMRWMLQQASACGLSVEMIPTPAEDEVLSCVLHDSFGEFLGGIYSVFSDRYYRPAGRADDGPQTLDRFVRKRVASRTDYRPKNEGLFSVPECDEAWYNDIAPQLATPPGRGRGKRQ
jgi:uncharacterized protein (DUF2235 family)